MDGKVKWFSKEKGFGFIVGLDGKDHFAGATNVKGADLPNNGDIVTFDPVKGKRGPRAENVTIKKKFIDTTDSRVICRNCGKKIIPRIITGPPFVHGSYGWTPVPKSSICTFCGGTFREFPPSFGEKIGSVIFIIIFVLFFVVILHKINTAHKKMEQNTIFPSINISDAFR